MDLQTATPNTEAAILRRVIDAGDDPHTPEVARYLLSMRLPAADEDRVNELSAKARDGSLTGAEAQELDSYLHIGFLLGILQAKARNLLDPEPGTKRR